MPGMLEADTYILLFKEQTYYDLSSAHVVPSAYVDTNLAGWKVVYEEEATDREILRFAERSGQLDFLSDPAEDIYGSDDGEAV